MKEVIGSATLYCGDCLDILPTLEKVDAVVTDPPYGIGEAKGRNKSRSKIATSKDYGRDEWDNEPCSAEQIDAITSISINQIIFGGNYFDLPPSSCWLVWDKENGESDFADCELAWTNLNRATRLKRHMWHGMLRASERGFHVRVHPTQKPIVIMEWCLSHIPDAQTILDPFMGSGTTGIACMNLGREFIGIEREQKYFDIACERITMAQAQGRLFE